MPKIQIITDEKSIEKYGGSRMYFAPPLDYDRVMRQVPEGKVITVGELREFFARQNQADFTDPITAGIFVSICAWASFQHVLEYGRQRAQRIVQFAGGLRKAVGIDRRFVLVFRVEGIDRHVDRHDVLERHIQRRRLLGIQQRLLQHLGRHDARRDAHRAVGLFEALFHLHAQLFVLAHNDEKLTHQFIPLILE